MSAFGQLITYSQEHSVRPKSVGIRAVPLFIIVALHAAIASASSPVITQSNPTDRGIQMTIAAGSATLSATLYGNGFATGAVVRWTPGGGTTVSLQTTYLSATQLVAQVPASLLTDPGAAVLTTRNPDGLTSNAWPVNVVPRPVITQSNPSDGGVQMTIAAASAALPITLVWHRIRRRSRRAVDNE